MHKKHNVNFTKRLLELIAEAKEDEYSIFDLIGELKSGLKYLYECLES